MERLAAPVPDGVDVKVPNFLQLSIQFTYGAQKNSFYYSILVFMLNLILQIKSTLEKTRCYIKILSARAYFIALQQHLKNARTPFCSSRRVIVCTR